MPGLSKTFSRLSAALLAVAVAGPILYLALPRTAVAFLTIPGDKVHQRIVRGEPVTAEQLEVFVRSRKQALAWTENPSALFELTIGLKLQRDRRSAEERRQIDEQMLGLSRRSLRQSPVTSRAWLRLAAAERRLNGDTELAAEALAMSFLTGPVLPFQAVPRLRLALSSKRFMRGKDRNLTFRDIRIAWRHRQEEALAFSATSERRVAYFRAALASDPAEYQRYNRLLGAYRAKRARAPSAL